MNYLKALKEKNLMVDALPKNVQSKIKQLEKLNESIAGLDIASLSEEDLESVDSIREQVDGLDSYISHKIEIFNPEKYAEKLRVIELLNNNKKAQQGKKEEELNAITSIAQPKIQQPAQEPETAPNAEMHGNAQVLQPEQAEDEGQAPVIVFQQHEEHIPDGEPDLETKVESAKHVEKKQQLDEALNQLRQTVKPKQSLPPDAQKTEQVKEEFEKVGDAKPRKKYKGIGLMALGIFVFSLGTVIYYKE